MWWSFRSLACLLSHFSINNNTPFPPFGFILGPPCLINHIFPCMRTCSAKVRDGCFTSHNVVSYCHTLEGSQEQSEGEQDVHSSHLKAIFHTFEKMQSSKWDCRFQNYDFRVVTGNIHPDLDGQSTMTMWRGKKKFPLTDMKTKYPTLHRVVQVTWGLIFIILRLWCQLTQICCTFC